MDDEKQKNNPLELPSDNKEPLDITAELEHEPTSTGDFSESSTNEVEAETPIAQPSSDPVPESTFIKEPKQKNIPALILGIVLALFVIGAAISAVIIKTGYDNRINQQSTEIERLQQASTDGTKEIEETNKTLMETNTKLEEEKTTLTTANKELTEAKTDLEKKNKTLTEQLKTAAEEAEAIEKESNDSTPSTQTSTGNSAPKPSDKKD